MVDQQQVFQNWRSYPAKLTYSLVSHFLPNHRYFDLPSLSLDFISTQHNLIFHFTYESQFLIALGSMLSLQEHF